MLLRKKEEIEAWLNFYKIRNYEIISNEEYGYVVNVNGHVKLFNKNIKNIEVKFNEVNGNFTCGHNQLKSLEGSPKIVKATFACQNNELKSLKGCPENINQFLYASNNLLTIEGLKYLPKEIKNNIIQLEYNEKLGELQHINNFNELKEKISILIAKDNLLNIINKENFNEQKIINKL